MKDFVTKCLTLVRKNISNSFFVHAVYVVKLCTCVRETCRRNGLKKDVIGILVVKMSTFKSQGVQNSPLFSSWDMQNSVL